MIAVVPSDLALGAEAFDDTLLADDEIVELIRRRGVSILAARWALPIHCSPAKECGQLLEDRVRVQDSPYAPWLSMLLRELLLGMDGCLTDNKLPLFAQVKPSEAETLYESSQAIQEKVLTASGASRVATSLLNCDQLLGVQVESRQSIPRIILRSPIRS